MHPEPVHCRRPAYDLFASQMPIIESREALLTAAVAIAMHEMEDADAHAVDMKLQALADRVQACVRGSSPQALLAHAHDVLFEQEQFAGNTQDYECPLNSYLPAVLETRRGIPITLTLIYTSVMNRLGINVYGINAPLHFLAGVELPDDEQPMFVDPFFGGKVLSREEGFQRLEEIIRRPIRRSEPVFAPATHRQWLARMLRNLQVIFKKQGRPTDLAAMVEMEGLLRI